MKVLVVGASGYMGRETVRQSLDAGMQVRAMTRTPEKAGDLKQMGAEVVQGDLIDPPSLARACQGMEAVVSAAHSLLGAGKYRSAAVDDAGQRALLDAAKAAGVKHFVFASMLGVSPDSPLDFIRFKAQAEQYVQASGMTYTILRPSAFMEWHAHNFLGKDILEKGKATLLGKGEALLNYISARDVAKYAVIGLTNPRACNRTIEVGGLDNVTKTQIAQMYIQESGKPAEIGHMPRFMLRFMSVVMKLDKPEISRVMLMSYLDDITDKPFDPSKTLAEFPVDLLRLSDFIKIRVGEWKTG